MEEKFELRVKAHFDAAHALRNYPGECQNLHGHRWVVEFCIEGGWLDDRNMLADFGAIKTLMHRLIRELDHRFLNDVLHEDDPTAEFIAKWLFDGAVARFVAVHTPPIDHQLRDAVKRGLRLTGVWVWETPECGVRYCRPYPEGV